MRTTSFILTKGGATIFRFVVFNERTCQMISKKQIPAISREWNFFWQHWQSKRILFVKNEAKNFSWKYIKSDSDFPPEHYESMALYLLPAQKVNLICITSQLRLISPPPTHTFFRGGGQFSRFKTRQRINELVGRGFDSNFFTKVP